MTTAAVAAGAGVAPRIPSRSPRLPLGFAGEPILVTMAGLPAVGSRSGPAALHPTSTGAWIRGTGR